MKRSTLRFQDGLERVRPLVIPTLLSVIIFVLSTLGFIYQSRNDLLIFAAMHRNVLSANLLVQAGAVASTTTENFPDPALIEYLHGLFDTGVQKEGVELAETLLRAGGSLSQRSTSGWTPLMLAAGSGQSEIVQLFLRHGADIDARGLGDEESEGMTALMTAAMHGHAGVVQLLTDRGSNIHLRSRAGYTALLLSATHGHLTCVEILLRKGAAVPLSTVQVAERNGHKAVAERLRQAMEAPRFDTLTRRPAKTPEE